MSCIGIFDSGLGGLTVWAAIQQQAPQLPCLYLADQAHLPYGTRSVQDIQALSAGVTRALLDQGARLIVLACNTASAAALEFLRAEFPGVPFVGMEPAVKPAALSTRSGVVGLMATRGTLQGALLRNTAKRFAQRVQIVSSDCPGLAEAIEAAADHATLRGLLDEHLHEMKSRGADTIVLGCTHYPLIEAEIRASFDQPVQLIDPAPAVARQVLRLWEPIKTDAAYGPARFASTATTSPLQNFLLRHFKVNSPVQAWHWNGAKLQTSSVS